jgi:hypothetical protein
VKTVKVLESPDELIAGTLRDALMKWSFQPVVGAGGVALPITGKLVFYFLHTADAWIVTSPAEIFALKK